MDDLFQTTFLSLSSTFSCRKCQTELFTDNILCIFASLSLFKVFLLIPVHPKPVSPVYSCVFVIQLLFPSPWFSWIQNSTHDFQHSWGAIVSMNPSFGYCLWWTGLENQDTMSLLCFFTVGLCYFQSKGAQAWVDICGVLWSHRGGLGEKGWHKRGNMNGFQKSVGVQGKRISGQETGITT